MTSIALDPIRRYRVPAYLIFAVTSILPMVDLVMTIWPMHPGTVMWRFGAVGLVSGAIGAPLLVLTLVYAVALFAGDRRVVITVSILAALIGLFLLIGAGAFSLDALQMKGRVNPQALDKFKTASAVALIKLLVLGFSSLFLSVSAFRASRTAKREAARVSRPGATLVVGQTGAAVSRNAPVERAEGALPVKPAVTEPKI